jgi:isoleucyl-tRNA synthetase
MPVFDKVPGDMNFPKEEREVLALWKEKKIFERTLERPSPNGTFVFYEGPPTANGMPHNGHVLTRVIKDLFPRYKTMRGYKVPRKAGWDTHGLPVEVEVEKELRIHGKAEIEKFGVEPFVKKCIESVFRYTQEWEGLTERIGFWVDLPSAYVTFHKSYVESVWWALSKLFEKGLLYQGHKVVWWWAQGGTALSAGEVGLGYKQVDDPSVYVKFPLVGEADGASLLVWTTTPWTLSSNMYAAVDEKSVYARVTHGGDVYVMAEKLVPELAKKLKTELPITERIAGKDLVGKRYAPPFETFASGAPDAVWRVIAADFVTLDSGTGIVHIAPAFGEDDFTAHKHQLKTHPDLPLFCAVRPDGTFGPEMGKYEGRWVKDADKDLAGELKERGLLVLLEQYRHDYPFCWRSDADPLIQYARPAWYIRTTQEITRAIANNQEVQWLPEHIKSGRMGDFLANNVDWALSRERYWGTPLNIWICDAMDHREAPSSIDEIKKRNPTAFKKFDDAKKADPSLSEHLVVHKPWIDDVTFPCKHPGCTGTMRRVSEVIDCWFDSGCMPFAQWGYPHQGEAAFKESFPADFISEAIDQTRGWFYTLLMIATLVFDDETQKAQGITPVRGLPLPFKTCIVLGHVSDKEGKKESKSKGNYTPPEIILDAVQMDFAVVGEDKSKEKPTKGTAFIAKEDLEGMDMTDGAKVRLDAGGKSLDVIVKAGKGMKRRVVLLAPEDRAALGVEITKVTDVKPVEVPRITATERVTLVDPTSPAPGADAFRWFFYASNPPWNATRHSLSNVRALQKDFLIKLRNVYAFFTLYANPDGWEPTKPRGERKGELDRWILSELSLLVEDVTKDLDGYDVYAATGRITSFVDALSNWWLRRSRDRFWKSGWDDDKLSAYGTLYEALVTLSQVIAPFVPFAAEAMHQNLVVRAKVAGAKDSVHLCDWPAPDAARTDRALSAKMRAVRELVSLGLQVRTQAKLKVRQPLRRAHLIVGDAALRDRLAGSLAMIQEELNVLEVRFVPMDQVRSYVEYNLKPNFRTLGQRGLGKQAQELKKTMGALPAEEAAQLVASLAGDGKATYAGIELLAEDVEIAFTTKEGFAAAGGKVGVVVLETVLDEELKELGFVRELQSKLQQARKDKGLEITDRVEITYGAAQETIAKHAAHLMAELLCTKLTFAADAKELELEVDGVTVPVTLKKAP